MDRRIAEMRALIARHKVNDQIFGLVGLACMMVAVVMLLAAFVDLFVDGAHRLTWQFFTSFPSRRAGEAGILSAWVGTGFVMLTTMLAAVPLGVAAAVYLEEYAPKHWITDLIEINVTNLAGVPSIVYGLLALGLFVYQLGFGQSILSAGLTLALMILPIVIVATREALRSIPTNIREAAYALGATRWQMVSGHLIPYARGGILTGVIIGMSRAIGETAPIITIGALTFIAFLPVNPEAPLRSILTFDWLWQPFTVLPIQMFNWVSRPDKAFLANAAAAGVVLILMTLAMNGLAIYLRYSIRKKIKW